MDNRSGDSAGGFKVQVRAIAIVRCDLCELKNFTFELRVFV